MVSHEIERFSIAKSSAGALRGGGAACGDQQVQGQEEAQVTPPALVIPERMGRAAGPMAKSMGCFTGSRGNRS